MIAEAPILIKMAGIVYLRTNRFEVKLEGITFKNRDFESLCSVDFLFPDGKTWTRQPVVGIDVMRHPRDPNNILLLLCFGVGCVILKFNSGAELPDSIFKFLTDDRIRFVGFGIPEKKDLFPLEELGLTKEKVDIGFLTAKVLDDHKYKKYELAELARKILRVKHMIGLTQSSSFERHEQIKCAICQLFITSAIAMALLGKCNKKKLDDAVSKRSTSFLKNLNQLPLFTEGWFKFPKNKKIHAEKNSHEVPVETTIIDGFSGDGLANSNNLDVQVDDDSFEEDDLFHGKCVDIPYGDDDDDDCRFHAGGIKGFFDGALNYFKNNNNNNKDSGSPPSGKEDQCISSTPNKQPLKGILKSSSSSRLIEVPNLSSSSRRPDSRPLSPESSSSSSEEIVLVRKTLRRANSKGFNVSFK